MGLNDSFALPSASKARQINQDFAFQALKDRVNKKLWEPDLTSEGAIKDLNSSSASISRTTQCLEVEEVLWYLEASINNE